MFTSIKKATKSILARILIAIIILPFLFWGMGDVFRSGNQNVVVTIDSEKISAQNFVEYVNRLNLNKQQLNSIAKTDLLAHHANQKCREICPRLGSGSGTRAFKSTIWVSGIIPLIDVSKSVLTLDKS